jgi:hypothetical protein
MQISLPRRIPNAEFTMAIGFQSPAEFLENLRLRLRKMSDEELIRFGKAARGLSGQRRETPDLFKIQLDEARAEWRRMHPRQS